MHPFEEYLKKHNIEGLAVSITARVRYMTVYNAMKGLPISPDHARKIRRAVMSMTQDPYFGTFALTHPEPEDTPTMPIQIIKRHNLI